MKWLWLAVFAIALYVLYRLNDVRLKAGVDLTNISWRIFWAAIVAEGVYSKYGAELVVTSGVDSEHSEHSMHYKGLAIDVRTNNLGGRETQVASEVQDALGTDYAVILEKDHIHIQYSWENVRGGNPYA